jgi:uncharacterized membrane protein
VKRIREKERRAARAAMWAGSWEFEWMWSSSFMYLYCILSLYLIIWTSPVDVSDLPNHVKYCVSVLSFQWATISTSPVGFPNNWYQSIWFKVVFDFCLKIKVVKIVFLLYHRVEEEETSTPVKTVQNSDVGHGRTRRRGVCPCTPCVFFA